MARFILSSPNPDFQYLLNFAGKEQADQFIKENGGEPANFDKALTAAYEDMNQDTRMIRERRKMMKKQHSGH